MSSKKSRKLLESVPNNSAAAALNALTSLSNNSNGLSILDTNPILLVPSSKTVLETLGK